MTSAKSVTNATVVTASGFVVGDSLGWPYELPYAVGNRGALMTQSLMYMTASGLAPQIRVHFYAQSASGVTAGVENVLDPALHLGFIDHNVWYSAGGGLVMSQVDEPNIVLDNNVSTNARSVWAVLEARQTAFGFGGSATPLRHKIGGLQD
jgi:hypothetical protein